MREEIEPGERLPSNRYFEGSPVYPGRFAHNWNRSYILLPEGQPRGAVVLLHGLSDSPYSLRHVARIYATHGYAAVGLRLPGHGTVPAGLASARWQDWQAATRLAVREAQRLAGPGKPLHIVGYSNGGALAVQYTADAAQDSTLALPSQVVLFSPMIGLTRFARYAGIAGWPALLPRFSKSAWLEIVPEFNPFKYSSFPVNAARQSYELTQVLNEQFADARGKRRTGAPPAGAGLPVRSGFDRARRCAGQRAVRQTTEERQRDRGIRREPRDATGTVAVAVDAGARRSDAAGGSPRLSHHGDRQFSGRGARQ